MTDDQSGFEINGIIIPIGSYFYCPKCGYSMDLRECDGMPHCPEDNTELNILTPDHIEGNDFILTALPGKHIIIIKSSVNFPVFPGSSKPEYL